MLTYRGDPVSNGNTFKIIRVTERIAADRCDRIGNNNESQFFARAKCSTTDVSDGVGDGYAGQTVASLERIVADGCDGVGDNCVHAATNQCI